MLRGEGSDHSELWLLAIAGEATVERQPPSAIVIDMAVMSNHNLHSVERQRRKSLGVVGTEWWAGCR